MGVKNLTPINGWPCYVADKVKRKPGNFEAYLCGSRILLLKHLTNHIALEQMVQGNVFL